MNRKRMHITDEKMMPHLCLKYINWLLKFWVYNDWETGAVLVLFGWDWKTRSCCPHRLNKFIRCKNCKDATYAHTERKAALSMSSICQPTLLETLNYRSPSVSPKADLTGINHTHTTNDRQFLSTCSWDQQMMNRPMRRWLKGKDQYCTFVSS